MTDLDKGGRGFQRVRTYLGPSLGWTDEYVQPSVEVETGGIYVVKPGDSLILVNAAAGVVIQLPDVVSWVQQTANQPATGFDRGITVKDIGGNAANFNIVVAPFAGQTLDNIQQQLVISANRAVVRFVPLIDLTGWVVEANMAGASGGGGGDVFKAGNNTFTGTNIFSGPIFVPTADPSDNDQSAASTAFVKSQNYLTSVSLVPYALLLDPTFQGDPRAPTPNQSNNSDTIATTAFVHTATAGYQPLDNDLTSIAAATGSGAGPNPSGLYYRRSDGDWRPLNLSGLSISLATDTLTSAAGGGNVSTDGTALNLQLAQWTGPNNIQGIDISALGYAPLANPAFTGNPTAPTPPNADNDTSIATTAFVKSVAQPLDGDLTALAASTGTNTIYYRSGVDVWSPVTMGSNMTFSGGVLNASLAGGAVPEAPNDGNQYVRQSLGWVSITGAYQPLDADLTSLAAASAFGSGPSNSGLYYRKSANNWVPLNLSGLTINSSTDTISAAAGGANVTISDTPPASPNQGDLWWESDSGTLYLRYNDPNTNQWVGVAGAAIGAPIDSPNFTGNPTAPTPTAGDNDTSIATTAFVQAAVGSGGFSTGDVKLTIKTVADAGWLLMNDTGIGNTGSGATNTGAQYQALFMLMYNNIADAFCPITTSAGSATTRAAQGTALTAWNNLCRMTMLKTMGRAMAGAGVGAGLTGRSLGEFGGADTFTLTSGHIPNHIHTIPPHSHGIGPWGDSTLLGAPGAGATLAAPGGQGYSIIGAPAATQGSGTLSTDPYTAGGTGLSIVQATTFLNVMIKL